MQDKKLKAIKIILAIMIAIFLAIVAFFVFQEFEDFLRRIFIYMAVLAFIFLVLGIVLIVLAVKADIPRKLKIYLIMVGASAASFLTGVILHNLVYALMIVIFGEGFWGEGGDEAFFFIVALIVAPLMFVVGVIGSVVGLIKKS